MFSWDRLNLILKGKTAMDKHYCHMQWDFSCIKWEDNGDKLNIDWTWLFLKIRNYALFHIWLSIWENWLFNGKTQ